MRMTPMQRSRSFAVHWLAEQGRKGSHHTLEARMPLTASASRQIDSQDVAQCSPSQLLKNVGAH